MADAPAKDRAAQQWPSPWPYDFPVEGKVPSAPDKVARVAGAEPQAPLTLTRRSLFSASMLGWGAFATAGGIGTLGLVRFLFPNVSFEAPQVFRTAQKGKFAPNTGLPSMSVTPDGNARRSERAANASSIPPAPPPTTSNCGSAPARAWT